MSLCPHSDSSGRTDSPAKIRVSFHRQYGGRGTEHAGWYCTTTIGFSPLFLHRVAHSKHSPNRASSRVAQAPPTSAYMTMEASGGQASSGTTTLSEQMLPASLLWASQLADTSGLPEQTGIVPLHVPAEEQSSNLEPLRGKLCLHAKRHSEPKLKFPRGCEQVMERRGDKTRMGSHCTAGTR